MVKQKKHNFNRKEVAALLRKQISGVRNSVGRMDGAASDLQILKRITKCRIVKF